MKQPSKSSDNRQHTADTRNPDWEKYAPDGQGRTDEQIRADVHQLLLESGESGGPTLSVSVGDGIVTLSGEVATQEDRQRVAELVRSVPSVKDVLDQMQVQSDQPS